jgi:GTPase SAR1 family protein
LRDKKKQYAEYATCCRSIYQLDPVLCSTRKWPINHFQVRNEFYKDTQGVLLVFDVSSQQSFDGLQSWLNEMKKEIGDPADMDKVVFVVCANKVSRAWAKNN